MKQLEKNGCSIASYEANKRSGWKKPYKNIRKAFFRGKTGKK